MPKTSRWREILAHTEKPKIRVKVGGKHEDLTSTQAYRFEELTQPRAPDPRPDAGTVSAKMRYTLAEASDYLNVGERHLLQQAVFGSVSLYVNAGGLNGRWRRGASDGSSAMSPVHTLISGYLALTSRSCNEMAAIGSTRVSVLEFRCPSDSSAVDLDRETLAALSAWGDSDKHFCLLEPLRVDPNKIVLLAPLADSAT